MLLRLQINIIVSCNIFSGSNVDSSKFPCLHKLNFPGKNHYQANNLLRRLYLNLLHLNGWNFLLVMFRDWTFRALDGLGLLCIGPRAGRAFLYRVSSFFRAFPKYKMYPHFCLMSMKYEVFLLCFLKLSIGYKFGPR